MILTWNTIERGFERFLELLADSADATREFQESRAEFFATKTAALVPLAERRHLEWFLLERPSAALSGVPAQVWRGELAQLPGELAPAFLDSFAGAFELSTLIPGEGLWVRDLFTQGEHPVAEPAVVTELETGDLLVGRLFPAGAGLFLPSPAMVVFRNTELLAAVKADLEGMRAARRGVLRVQQLELEHLFYGPEATAGNALGRTAPDEARAAARAALHELGVSPTDAARLVGALEQGARAGRGNVVTEVLNQLAFETAVDLARARLVLTELWESERGMPPPPGGETTAHGDAYAALEAFDRGRAEGKDLETLFRELERDLGIDEELADEELPDGELPDDQADEGVPDFPGVVGAMVEEFLWDVGREHGPERARAWESLRALGTYGLDIGVFDELGSERMLDFTARWVLDETDLAGTEMETLLDALSAFCRWCETSHALVPWSGFEEAIAGLRSSLPRHRALRRELAAGPGQGLHVVLRLAAEGAVVRACDGGEELELSVSAAQRSLLREGDLVRVVRRGSSRMLGASYPTELRALAG